MGEGLRFMAIKLTEIIYQIIRDRNRSPEKADISVIEKIKQLYQIKSYRFQNIQKK